MKIFGKSQNKTKDYMNTKNIKWLTGSLMTAALAAGISACSDDHFDINSEALGKTTIWQNIKSNEQLSEYADILQSVQFSATEEKATRETYAQVLDGDQTFTVCAPLNGTFNYEYYKSLLAYGKRDSTYKVEKELIRNNMTRYSHTLNSGTGENVELFNAKTAVFSNDEDGMAISGAKITKANVGASNGVLHITNGTIDYKPNLYEYLASRADLSNLNEFIKSFQTTEFNEGASTQGPTINGQVTWVDSITYITNDYTNYYLGAKLEKEDSLYAMIMPTNDTWDAMLKKTKKYFNFKTTYKQDVHTQTASGADTIIEGALTKFTQAEIDSLNNFYSKNAIAQDLAYNANWQYEKISIKSIKDIQDADTRLDSLRTTSGVKFKKTGTLNGTNGTYDIEVDNFAALFGNADPVKVSNGYAYVVNDFLYPTTTFAPTLDRSGITAYESSDNSGEANTLQKKYENPKVTIDGEEVTVDSIYRYNYLVMKNKNATSQPGAYFKMNNVLSCKYDIYVVIGYNTDNNLQNKFRAYISYDTESSRQKDYVLKNPNEDAVDAKGDSQFGKNFFINRPPHYNEKGEVDFTDTICIAKDFEFPVSYIGLSNAYPVIQLKSNFTSTEKNYYAREIWVNAIIFKAKGHDEEE